MLVGLWLIHTASDSVNGRYKDGFRETMREGRNMKLRLVSSVTKRIVGRSRDRGGEI